MAPIMVVFIHLTLSRWISTSNKFGVGLLGLLDAFGESRLDLILALTCWTRHIGQQG